MTDDSERLVEQIKRLKARYFRYLDAKDYDGLDTIFADDALIDVRGSTSTTTQRLPEHRAPAVGGLDDGLMSGRDLKQFFRTSIANFVTVHHGHMPEIELLSATTARGIWAFEDHLWFEPGSPYRVMHGWGHYHDSYACTDGEWRVSAMRITRIRVENIPWT